MPVRTVLARFMALALFLPAFASAVFAEPQIDPSERGPYAVIRAEYAFSPATKVSRSSNPNGADYEVPFNGSVHFPKTGDGPFPLLVFMHGRHTTCIVGGQERIGVSNCKDMPLNWPLPLVPKPAALYQTDPIDSYRGYDYLAENLASHGYVVASINANVINDKDQSGDLGITGRGQLFLRTIDHFEKLAQMGRLPIIPPHDDLGLPDFVPLEMYGAAGRIDMTRIGLMGHSRGGEGVTRAIELNNAGFEGKTRALKAVFSIAPTDFNSVKAINVPYATLLPYCDGDVSNLWGADIYDDSRYASESTPSPKMQITVLGANHNWYNTVWWFDDVGYSYPSDPYCGRLGTGAGRFTEADQRLHGLAMMASFFRLYVGGETQFAPYFTGAAEWPASACPAARKTCRDLFHMTYMEPAGSRRIVEDAASTATLTGNDLGGATTLSGFASSTICTPSGCPGNDVSKAPMLGLGWRGTATYSTQIPAASGDVSGFDALTLRATVMAPDGLNPAGKAQDFRIVLTDASGKSASVKVSQLGPTLYYPPGGSAMKVVPNEVRAPLEAFQGINLQQVRTLDLVFDQTATGLVGISDIVFQDDA